MEESLACAALRRAGRVFLPSIAIRTRWGAGARSRRDDATLIASEQARAARPNGATPYHARRSGRGRHATSWLCDRVTLPHRAPPRHLARRARVQRRHAECGAKLRNFICFANSDSQRSPARRAARHAGACRASRAGGREFGCRTPRLHRRGACAHRRCGGGGGGAERRARRTFSAEILRLRRGSSGAFRGSARAP